MKRFSKLFWYYFHIFLVFKGHYSKNVSRQKRKEICEDFCDILHLPASVLHLLLLEGVNSDQLKKVNILTLGEVKNISEDEILNTFSHLTPMI
ncbi:MAG: hypothetical protein Lokiarch_51090 [Candidatus Lokiarchaeum sp. GC14_75]|nr:MAG: hypothetical protein Lokiarch_51090 [Candidatus Lokiarchaeum sp. GC14_75]